MPIDPKNPAPRAPTPEPSVVLPSPIVMSPSPTFVMPLFYAPEYPSDATARAQADAAEAKLAPKKAT